MLDEFYLYLNMSTKRVSTISYQWTIDLSSGLNKKPRYDLNYLYKMAVKIKSEAFNVT